MSAMVATHVALDRLRFGAGGGVYHVVATAAETNNTIYAFEATEPPGGGPPLHTHAAEEEFFFVLEGEITFHIGGRLIRGTKGTSAFVPRGVPHCFKNRSNHEARLLILFSPANIEGFFDGYGASDENGNAPPNEVLLQRIVDIGPRYGLEVLGPSPL